MNAPILIEQFDAPPVSEKEILRYAGCRTPDAQILALIRECTAEILPKLSYKLCFSEFSIAISENTCDLDFTVINSSALAKNLEHCHKAYIFAATIGLEIDRMIAKYARLSPTKALIFQAIGAERIEALCDLFCDRLQQKILQSNQKLHPRFSPGYGDLPLEFQRSIFAVLDCPKKIGVFLNESLLMSPSKSVTAIIGVECMHCF